MIYIDYILLPNSSEILPTSLPAQLHVFSLSTNGQQRNNQATDQRKTIEVKTLWLKNNKMKSTHRERERKKNGVPFVLSNYFWTLSLLWSLIDASSDTPL